MPRAIDPAEPVLSADGIPFSPRFDELYHSPDGGLAQAHHVFLGGNGLPAAWRGRDQFVIVETGFGQGLNFLATWQAWRQDPARCGRLHIVSIEKYPFTRAGLDTVHATLDTPGGQADLAPLARELRDAWPLPLPGLHRLAFDNGAVVLTLAFGDVEAMLPKLELGADAFYLDGFSPARNPDMWAPRVLKRLARLARPGATLATYTAAGAVRRDLQAAGFEVSKVPGYGTKWHMTVARFPAQSTRRRHAPLPRPAWSTRHAIVIGAGLAGCAATERLAARGWRITLIDAEAGPARLTSSHRAAAMHSHLSPDDSLLSRLSRAGNLHSLRAWRALADAGHPVGWNDCGVLQIGESDEDVAIQRAALVNLGFPEDFVRWMTRDEAVATHGAAVPRGGLWFGLGGWGAPPDICRAQLARAGAAVTTRFGCHVETIEHGPGGWVARGADGTELAAAPVMVLANARDASRLLPGRFMEQRCVLGQLTTLDAENLARLGAWPDCVVTGGGYLLPVAADGAARVGSSYEDACGPLLLRASVHEANLGKLAAMLPALAGPLAGIDPAGLGGYVGVRSVSHNRLPLIGQMADELAATVAAAKLRGAHLRDLPRLPGLYASLAFASRGLTWAALGAEVLASMIEGEPLPVESDLADALDPARLLLRALRHGKAHDAAAQQA